MGSFELIYEEEEDILEVTFVTFDEHFSRTITLNDNITVYTDLGMTSTWGITFYSYRVLLQISETHLDGLRLLPEIERRQLLGLFGTPPFSLFLELLAPGELRARVKAPALEALL